MKENRPSETAIGVCAGLVVAGYLNKSLVARHIHALSIDALKVTRPALLRSIQLLAKVGGLKFVNASLGAIAVPEIVSHLALRKKTIFKLAKHALNECQQCVVLSGGFDFLALEVANTHPKINVIETDHPATQLVKKEVLDVQRPPHNFHLLSIDYTKSSLKDALVNFKQFDPSTKTLFVAEGLLMYLSIKEISELFSTLKHVVAPGSAFIFTSLIRDQDAPSLQMGFQDQSRLMSTWLNFIEEPMLTDFTHKELQSLLVDNGLELKKCFDNQDMAEMWEIEVELPRGEEVLYAEF